MAVVGLTIGIDADTKKFNKEIKKMDKSIRQTNTEVFNLSKSLDIKWDAKQFLRAQKLAQDSLEQTEIKVKSLRDRLKFLDETGTDKTSAEYENVQRALSRAEFQAAKFGEKLKEIKDLKIEKLAGQFDKVGKSIENTGKKLLPLSAAAGALLVGFAKIGSSAIEAGDDIATMSTSLNISAEALQRWNFIAEQTDVGTEKFAAGTVKIQDALANLAQGNLDGPAKAMQSLGITTEQASLGMEANLENIINALADLESETQQVALANEIFGTKLGASMIPLLKVGSEGVAELSSEFETFGFLTNEQVNSLGELDGTLDKLKFGFEQIKNQLGAALIPLMTTLAGIIQTNVIPFVQKLAEWFGNLSEAQMSIIFGVLAFITALAPMLIIFGKLTSGIGGLIKMVKGLRVALTFLSAHPIILVITVVIGLLALLYARNEQFRDSINGLVKTLGSALMPILNVIMGLFQTLFQSLMPLIDALLNILSPILSLIINQFSGMVESIIPLINILLNVLQPILKANAMQMQFMAKVFQFIADILNKVVTFAIDKVAEGVQFLSDKLSKVLAPVLEFIGNLWGKVFGVVPSILQKVIDAIESTINGALDLINGLIKGFNAIAGFLGFDKLKELEDIAINVTIPDFEVPGFDEVVNFVGETVTKLATAPGVDTTDIPDAIPLELDTQNVIGEQSAGDLLASTSPTTNIDNSQRDIVINVTVENFADELDTDALISEINLKLAQQF